MLEATRDQPLCNAVAPETGINGEQKKMKVKLEDAVLPGDTIVVPQRFF